MSKTQPARGMRDFLPSDVRKRNYVISIIKEVYEKYGFEPLETPAVENLETLTGKYGEEGSQLMFKILKRGEKLDLDNGEKGLSDLALRYDLTVPLARVVANYKNELPKFFKRYQIQPVWRADRPARGRYREFYQCDVDAIGSSSMIVEAELISAVCEILERLGFEDFEIRINHRNLLTGILETSGVPLEKHTDALIALDKLDKIGREGVTREFAERGITDVASIKLLSFFEFFIKEKSNKFFTESQKLGLIGLQKKVKEQEEFSVNIAKFVTQIYSSTSSPEIDPNVLDSIKRWLKKGKSDSNASESIEKSQSEENLLNRLKELVAPIFPRLSYYRNTLLLEEILNFIGEDNKNGRVGIASLYQILRLTEESVSYPHIKVEPSLARGLSYYTGTIFEINVPDLAGSLGGGGRYDGLIGMFGKEQIPACGFSLGLERILVVMEERGMFPPDLQTNSADVMVTIWNEESIAESLKLANELRSKGLRVLVYTEVDKLGKQFKYAGQINVPYVCILGENELAENKVAVKNMVSGEQEIVAREDVAGKIK